MKKITGLVLLCSLFTGFSATAQNQVISKNNIVKINLTSAALFQNASLQFERVLTPKSSFALGVSLMPKTDLPFAEDLKEQYGDNPDVKRAIETTKLSNFTITPEYRFYMSGKAPAGFYVAPFARYQRMSFEQVYQFTASSGKVHNPLIGGNINNIGAGLLFGAQWLIGKNFTFDWWIAGPVVGKSNGLLQGTDDMSDLSAADRADLKGDIESTKLPLMNIEATVGQNNIDVKLDGGYAGLRAFGFNFGIRF